MKKADIKKLIYDYLSYKLKIPITWDNDVDELAEKILSLKENP